MKKVLVVLGLCAVISACGGNSKSGGSGTDSTTASNQTAKAQQSSADTNTTKIGTEKDAGGAATGAKLMVASDCNTCHKENEKVIGPALKDIAAKYPATDANVDSLTMKVIKGGSGHWGTVPMSPHQTIAVADARQMVKYILSLKK